MMGDYPLKYEDGKTWGKFKNHEKTAEFTHGKSKSPILILSIGKSVYYKDTSFSYYSKDRQMWYDCLRDYKQLS